MIRIPAIDLLDGKIVRLRQGNYDDVTVYSDAPVSFALELKDKPEISRLHIVDLNGARDGRFVNLDLVEQIVAKTGLEVQTGGGVRRFEDVEYLLDAGVSRVVSSSMAVKRPDEWLRALDTFGPGRCIFGMDLKDGHVAVGGWLETQKQPLEELLHPMMQYGLSEVLCTDIARDGMLTGPNLPMYADLQQRFPDLRFIASGGVSSGADLLKLESAGLFACVIGKAWLEGSVKL